MARTPQQRRGVTAVLAMLYLTLMASLALGFYSASNTAVMVSFNEQRMEKARLAAEGGLDFARFQLGKVAVPGKVPKDQHFATMAAQMAANVNGTENINKGTIYVGTDTVRVPADPNTFIKADDKGEDFQFVINDLGNDLVEVRVVGRYTQSAAAATPRGVKMDFALQQRRSSVLDFGIATRGSITMSGNAAVRGIPDPTKGSILMASQTASSVITTSGGTVITGDLSATNPNATFKLGGGTTVGGASGSDVPKHVHAGVDEPEFPEIDNSIFRPFATNKYVKGQKTYTNVYIPPNTNPGFSAGTVIKGVLFIDTPNKVSFSGTTTVQGVIAVQTTNPSGNLSTNQLSFSGGTIAQGVESLDDSFAELRKLTGSFILAPGFSLNMSGGFSGTGGAIVCDKLTMSGGTSGNLGGSLIIMQDTVMTMSGGSDITVGTATIGLPAGLKFSNHYLPLPSTYDEVKVK